VLPDPAIGRRRAAMEFIETHLRNWQEASANEYSGVRSNDHFVKTDDDTPAKRKRMNVRFWLLTDIQPHPKLRPLCPRKQTLIAK
jgi:hypothetical protein